MNAVQTEKTSALSVMDLSLAYREKPVLWDIDAEIPQGVMEAIIGPNGAGKSTLGNVIMGNPLYAISSGKIFFDGKEIDEESPDARAKAGIFLSFQNPLEIPGISLETFIRSAIQQKTGERVKLFQFQKELIENMKLLSMDESYAKRDLNVGFSGGERKKSEILQLLMLKPRLAILDETDSGLDVDAVRTVSKGIEEYRKKMDGGLLIITHSTKILESLKTDFTHIMMKGTIVATGDSSLIKKVNENGFDQFSS